MNKIKNEKGSLALFVTLAMLFFITFIAALYISTTNEQKTQLAITARIKETYEQNVDDESIEEVYNSFVGTDEYIPIYTAEQLSKVGTGESVYISEVGKYYNFNLNSNYILKRNIDLNKGKYTVSDDTITFTNATQWTPIGETESTAFAGIFDGNNHTISGLYINDTSKSNQGLFGYSSGTIKNVVLENGYINAKNDIGGIVAKTLSNSELNNCTNKNNIIGSGSRIGGICGLNKGTIESCSNSGNITCSGTYDVGGIVGKTDNSNSSVKKCYNIGKILGIRDAGGIIGTIQYGTLVEECYNNGEISSTEKYTGGIVGCAYDTGTIKISDCYNTGKTIGNDGTGGILGNNSNALTTIDKCYNTGNIIGTHTTLGSDNQYRPYVGGICGRANNNTIITNSYNEGQIEGNGIGVGGIIGYTSSTRKSGKLL